MGVVGSACRMLFSHAGPAAWNSLPPDFRAAASPAMFKKLLKTHFFNTAFSTCWFLARRLYDSVMHLCSSCNRRIKNSVMMMMMMMMSGEETTATL